MGVVGVSLLGVCVAMLRIADFGTDPFTVMVVSVAHKTKLSYQVVYPLVIGLFIVFVFFVNRKYIGIVTAINLVLVGIIADTVHRFLLQFSEFYTLGVRVGMFVATLLLLCLASSLYIVADLGVSSYDALSLIMRDKNLAQYRICRIITDASCVLIGILLAGFSGIGIGTIITAFFMGPITQFIQTNIAEPLRYGKNKKFNKKG